MKLTAGRGLVIGGFAAAASMALLMNGADAHHPEVSVSATCVDGNAALRIDSSSWITDNNDHRYNANVSIGFDGTVIGSGAYLPSNNYAFTVLYSHVADGSTHTVRATAVAGFGPSGEFGGIGEYREATVTLPNDCRASATTTTTAPVTTTTAPVTTTTAAGNVGRAIEVPTTTVPTVVAGVTETRPDVAVPVAVAPRFAG